MTPTIEAIAATAAALPATGAAFEGGIFAGITMHEDKLHALVLLPDDGDGMEWPDALEFAAKRNGVLPSRIDMLVLYKNVPKEFKPRWYWTGEEVTGYADYAWIQGFGFGNQFNARKDDAGRARAVRRVAI